MASAYLERRVSEIPDRLASVVHRECNSWSFEVVDVNDFLLPTIRGRVAELEFAGSRDDQVLGPVLISEGVTSDDDGLRPARQCLGEVLENEGLSEDGFG